MAEGEGFVVCKIGDGDLLARHSDVVSEDGYGSGEEIDTVLMVEDVGKRDVEVVKRLVGVVEVDATVDEDTRGGDTSCRHQEERGGGGDDESACDVVYFRSVACLTNPVPDVGDRECDRGREWDSELL